MVSAYRVAAFCGSTINWEMLWPNDPVETQPVPPFVLLRTGQHSCPPASIVAASTAAYTRAGVCGATARASTLYCSPVSTQLVPASVLLNSPPGWPPVCVTANSVPRFCGSTASALTDVADRPEFDGLQLAAPSVLLNIPEAVPAYSTLGFCESKATEMAP